MKIVTSLLPLMAALAYTTAWGDCSTCDILIDADKATATTVPAGQTLCVVPPVDGGNITITGDFSMNNGSQVNICTGPNDTVFFEGQLLVGGGPSNRAYINNFGNFVHQRPGALAAQWNSKLVIENYGYIKVANPDGTTGNLQLDAAVINHDGALIETVGRLIILNDGSVLNDGTIISHYPCDVNASIQVSGEIINNGSIEAAGTITVPNSGNLENHEEGTIDAVCNLLVEGGFRNNNLVSAGGTLRLNSGSAINISNGSFVSDNLYITNGGISALGGCASFLVYNHSEVTNGPTFTGIVHIQDLTLAPGDSIDVNNCTQSGCSNFTSGGGEGSCPSGFLPVTFIAFDGAYHSDHVLLHWSTASEENNAGFEVERSSDGIHYDKIGLVPGSGNSSEIAAYRFDDPAPPSGVIYYRLKQTDFDGSYAYSNVISLNINLLSVVSLYPNPATDGVVVQYDAISGAISCDLVDMYGKVYFSRVMQKGQEMLEFSVSNLPEGTYVLRIRDQTGLLQHKKLTVAH